MHPIHAKTWIYWAQAIFSGVFGLFCLVCGPLLLAGVMKPANAKPATGGGIALVVIGAVCVFVFLLAVASIRARKRPLIAAVDGDLEICFIGGGTSSDGVPMVSPIAGLVSLLVSRRGFQPHCVRIPAFSVVGVSVCGLPMARELLIQFEDVTDSDEIVLCEVRLPQVAFREPIDWVAATIQHYCHSATSGLTTSPELT